MNTTSAIRDRILHLCDERDITINKLATISALPPSSIKNILYGKSKDPKILTIKKICEGLEISLADFVGAYEVRSRFMILAFVCGGFGKTAGYPEMHLPKS